MTTHVKALKPKYIFLSPYRWLFNLCTLLLFTGFHIYPHTSVPRPQAPPLPPPPPADFAPVPSYLAFIRRHRSGTGLY